MTYPVLAKARDSSFNSTVEVTAEVELKGNVQELKESIERYLLENKQRYPYPFTAPKVEIMVERQYTQALKYLIRQAFIVQRIRRWLDPNEVFDNYIYEDVEDTNIDKPDVYMFTNEFSEALKFAVNSESMTATGYSYSEDKEDNYNKRPVLEITYYNEFMKQCITSYHFDDEPYIVCKLLKKKRIHHPDVVIRIQDMYGTGVPAKVKVMPQHGYNSLKKTSGDGVLELNYQCDGMVDLTI